MTDSTPAPAPAPGVAGPAQTLSLVAFIIGLVSLFLAIFVFGFGLLPGIAAIIIAVIARKREPAAPSWMRIVAIISGILAIVIGFIVFLVLLFATLLPLWTLGVAASTYQP